MIGRWIVALAFAGLAAPATAAIFGSNDLDSLTRAGTPNQCYLKASGAPPVGRVYILSGGDRRMAGSGATVGSGNIVVTAGHLFRTDNADHLRPGDRVVFSVWEGTPSDCRLVDHAASEVLIGTEVPVRAPSRDYAVLKLATPLTAYPPLGLGSPGMASAARAGGHIRIAGFAGHQSTHLGLDLSVEGCRGYAMPVWDPQWTIADSLIVFDCDTATGMSGSPLYVGRTFIGIATSAMNLSQGNAFNFKDNFNFGYALEPSLLRAVGCVRTGASCKGFDVRLLPN